MKVFITGNYQDTTFLKRYLTHYTNIDLLTQENSHQCKNLNFFRNLLIADITHIISIKPNGFSGIFWTILFLAAKLLNKKILLHWQGTDVLELKKLNGIIFSKLLPLQTAQASWLCSELRLKGVNSLWNPIVPPLPKETCPFPKVFSVLVYLGTAERREKFYGEDLLDKLSETFPNINFHVIGAKTQIKKSNIHNIGKVSYISMNEVYSKITVLLRVPKHDGLSFMVMEALARGRHVIWNKKFYYCFYANNIHEISKILERLSSVNPKFNNKGKQYIEAYFNPKYYVKRTVELYKKITAESAR